jgi:hypothetical protein
MRVLLFVCLFGACESPPVEQPTLPTPPPPRIVYVAPVVRPALPPPVLDPVDDSDDVAITEDEPDTDVDDIPDVEDRCPDAPEDNDGFADIDGCPDPG